MKLRRIISGGQTGADRAGLVAARMLGLETGGTAPKDYLTEDGSDPSLEAYGLVEHSRPGYPPRTVRNVIDSDATVILGDSTSRGSNLTRRLCDEYGKPVATFTLDEIIGRDRARLVGFLIANGVETLNVAGNRESSNPGLFARALSFLFVALHPHLTRQN